ncbi:MAG: protein kinase [Candidatus Eremiobacteraeota bacterium]|nr:protein kinase [Candidatus Eremiobacteraeota bacterium]
MEPEVPAYIGNYKIVRELGRGAMGTVFLAHQESLGRDLAIKVLAPEFTRDPQFVERFKREGRVAANLRHPNIVSIVDADSRDGRYFIVMEYVGDKDLRELLNREGKLSVRLSIKMIDQVLQALQHAHDKGVVHRDVKPANVLLRSAEEVALSDFSIAHIKDGDRLTRTGVMIGTPEYMAPEQFEGKGIDHRADLYAAGLVLYEMLTGVQPFRGDTMPEVMKAHIMDFAPNPCEYNSEIPAALGSAILKALEKLPERRYTDANVMRQALLEAAGMHEAQHSFDHFLRSVAEGQISMDDAIRANEMVREAIDQGFKKVLSVLMVDLAGSSAIKIPNQTLIADRAFRDYRSTINDILKKYGCQRFDWAGDGAICLFETPDQAVSAAVEIQTTIAEVGQRHQQLPGSLKCRIGINTGEVYVDPRRSLGEFASRTVDHAGHLEKDCPVGGIHVSQATMELTRHLVEYRHIGTNRDSVVVYEAVLPNVPVAEPQPVPARPAGAPPTPAVAQPKPVAPPKAAATPTRPMAEPKPTPAPAPKPGQPEAQPATTGFRLWWGWWMGVAAFFLGALGATMAAAGFGQAGASPMAAGYLTLLCLTIACPGFAAFYLIKKRYLAAAQSGAAFFVFLILLAVLTSGVQNL